jgi:hypothetical protein
VRWSVYVKQQSGTGNSIPGPNSALLSLTEVGAVCVSSARTDLCGGPLARAVPTATRKSKQASSANGHPMNVFRFSISHFESSKERKRPILLKLC